MSAKQALRNGDTADAINYVNLYYQSQTDFRGYATDALEVVNNQNIFGLTANQIMINDLGITQYGIIKPQLIVALAVADWNQVRNNGYLVPTEDQIANYHSNVFSQLNLDPGSWGGSAGAAMGQDWALGTLMPSELSANLLLNTYANTFTQAQTQAAIFALRNAGLRF